MARLTYFHRQHSKNLVSPLVAVIKATWHVIMLGVAFAWCWAARQKEGTTSTSDVESKPPFCSMLHVLPLPL
jgi:hypothetical protein